ncbi:MAG: hypothetical protein LC780_07960 [Acidobacteria bacterium]|nr:hypothetical protein [Acidobacteriota bacterium]
MRSVKNSRPQVLSALLALALVTAGCTGKLTAENYSKVSNGMTAAQAEAILGPGTEQASSGVAVPAMPAGVPATGPAAAGIGAPGTTVTTKVLVWRKGSKMITATFMNDQLVAKTQVGLD